MAEQFKKIYIPAAEFVKAWEKEVYELSNLDYFIYLLMNSVAEYLEHSFFPQQHKINEELLLDKDEITSLSFHIGDSVQLFFENNCFGVCTLNCPTQLDKKLSAEDILNLGKLPENVEFSTHSCSTKEDCLKYDLMNFVLIDAIIDYYHFDLRVTADEDDVLLQKLIHSVNNHIVGFIRNEGHAYLLNPRENASALFENLLDSEDSAWTQFEPWDDDAFDPDEPEELWKLPSGDLNSAIEEFKEYQDDEARNTTIVLDLFGKFITSYIGALNANDLVYEDLEEFMMVVLPTELSSDSTVDFEKEKANFRVFLSFVDYKYETNLTKYWNELIMDHTLDDVERSFNITQKYHQNNSYLDFQISPERNDPGLVEGFFEIVGKEGDLYLVEDIHLDDRYQVDLSSLESDALYAGDILNMHLIAGQKNWKAVWVECVFPRKAKVYLI